MHARAWGLIAGIRGGTRTSRTSRAERRIRAAAVAVGLLSQAVLWATYYYATGGCMCSVDGAPGPPTAAWIHPTLLVLSAPIGWLPFMPPIPLVTGPLLNLIAWTAGVYAVLKVTVTLTQSVRSSRAPSPRPPARL